MVMKVVGIDLSGPRNVADTHLVVFNEQGEELYFVEAVNGADDRQIFDAISGLGKGGQIVIGIDAPLSYNPGGGERTSDKGLRQLVLKKGGGVGVMPPTMIRMVYLTLRGVALARMLETFKPRHGIEIVEVHPGACMLLRDAPAGDVANFKSDPLARLHLLEWLERKGIKGAVRGKNVPDHFVAACAAALGAWEWALGRPAWVFPASPPEHPYDFAR